MICLSLGRLGVWRRAKPFVGDESNGFIGFASL